MNKAFVTMGGVIVAVLSAAALAGVTVGSNSMRSPKVVAAPSAHQVVSAAPQPKEVKKSVGGLEGVETTEGGKVYFRVTAFDPDKRTGTLTFIAEQYHTSVDQLVAWNHIQDRDLIHVHQQLRVH